MIAFPYSASLLLSTFHLLQRHVESPGVQVDLPKRTSALWAISYCKICEQVHPFIQIFQMLNNSRISYVVPHIANSTAKIAELARTVAGYYLRF